MPGSLHSGSHKDGYLKIDVKLKDGKSSTPKLWGVLSPKKERQEWLHHSELDSVQAPTAARLAGSHMNSHPGRESINDRSWFSGPKPRDLEAASMKSRRQDPGFPLYIFGSSNDTLYGD
jgi:hypothetical protein